MTGPRIKPEERELALRRKRERELAERRKPVDDHRPAFRPPRHALWFGRCPAFRPRTNDDANRETRL